MALYYRESGLTWGQYLQANRFVQDITGQLQRSGQEISQTISDETRDLIASNEALADAFDYGLEQISGEMAELQRAPSVSGALRKQRNQFSA